MKVVYFDGYCNVCNRFIDFLIQKDKRRRLRYASLQGASAEKRLPTRYSQDVSTVVFEDGEKLYDQSEAAIRVIAELGGIYGAMKLFLLVPRFLRDGVYRWVANHRYLWFGKRLDCRLATPAERALFLD